MAGLGDVARLGAYYYLRPSGSCLGTLIKGVYHRAEALACQVS